MAAILVFGVSLIFAVFTERSLYADGAYYFMGTLEKGGFDGFIPYRAYANYLMEWPLVLAIKLGLTDIPALQIAFGIGCFLIWPLAMALCYWLAPKNFWLVVLACGAGYLNAGFIATGEHIVAHAFFWPACFAILFARPLTPKAAAILIFSCVILLRSYESMMFLGPLLAVLALWRGCIEEKKIWQRVVLLLAAVLLVVSACISVYGLRHPGQGPRLDSFRSDAYQEMLFPAWTVGWTIFWGLLMFAGLSQEIRRGMTHKAGLAVLAIIILIWGAWPLLEPSHLEPWKQYEARFLNLAVPAFLLPVAIVPALRPAWFEPHRRYLVNCSAALLLAQSLWQVAATEQWRGYLNVWRNMQTTHTGIIDLLNTPYSGYQENVQNLAVGRQATGFVWIMDARNLSIEISGPRIKSIIDPAVGNRTLNDQYKPENLPHLERYGVDFSEYIRALTNNGSP